jgi:hypothetical protein
MNDPSIPASTAPARSQAPAVDASPIGPQLWTWPPYQPPRPPRDTVLCKLRRADRCRLRLDRLFCHAIGIPHDLADRLNGRATKAAGVEL